MLFLQCNLTNEKTHRQWLNGLKTFEAKAMHHSQFFDFKIFCTSISLVLFYKAVNFVKTIFDIPVKDIKDISIMTDKR